MAYTIYNNDGTVLSTIAIGEVDSFSTSLDLIGKNVNNYGEYYNTNLVRMLTNFASPAASAPRSPQVGQTWFDKTSKRLKVYDGVSFQPTYGSHVSGTQPITTSTGDFWYDTVNTQLKVWNGTSYNLVGPSTSGLLGKFGTLPASTPIRDNDSKLAQKVGVINSYGSYVGLWSTSSFTMEASSSTIYLGNYSINSIHEGLTIFKDLDVKRDVYISGKLKIDTDQIQGKRKDLSAYYNITPYGSYTATTTTSTFNTTGITNKLAYDNANRAIASDLVKMFSTATYQLGSQVSVICVYNTSTSVRKFELQALYPPTHWWEPLNNYSYSWSGSPSAPNQVTWLWSTSTNTNIVI
jgi:hypothetical protein